MRRAGDLESYENLSTDTSIMCYPFGRVMVNIRQMKEMIISIDGHAACTAEIRNARKILVETPEGKRPLERNIRGWEEMLVA